MTPEHSGQIVNLERGYKNNLNKDNKAKPLKKTLPSCLAYVAMAQIQCN